MDGFLECFGALCFLNQAKPIFRSTESHGSRSVEEQHDGEGGEGEDVVVDSETLVDADGGKGYQHVDCNKKCGKTGEEAEDKENAADELGVGGDVSEPVGKAEGGDVVSVVVQGAEGQNLLVSVDRHGDAEDETHEKRAGGLKAIEPFRHRRSLLKKGIAARCGDVVRS